MLGVVRLIFSMLAFGLSRPPPRSQPFEERSGAAFKTNARSAAEVQESFAQLPQARVRRVVDGDTVDVEWVSRTRIRLDSIDCPEGGQDWGDNAKRGLIKLIGGRKVLVEVHGRDDYGRTLATLYVRLPNQEGSLNVNERMVMCGHAWVMRRYYDHLPPDRQAKLNRLVAWAKSKRVGLWGADKPIPPWVWRRQQQQLWRPR